MKAKLISENVELKAQIISNVRAQPVITCFHLCLGFAFPVGKNYLQDPVCLAFSTIQWSRISNLHLYFHEFGTNFLEMVTQNSHEMFSN